ncbi:hypothetical protein KDX05_06965 [Burkholderia vietnamiensis]|uniref:hypothetical protein n=1 Tax=Burkholderia vietnamiensis TaxID=60552 RepID=UPI001B9D2FE2|nr:hypothetical protein [Burkholderia vietnamiensis]MBR8228051.1 hypothetical protein [Burkholderia vietnamiensis]
MKITDDMLTEWFPGYVKPIHVGEYERRYGENPFTDKWDGEKWVYGSVAFFDEECLCQTHPWRGLKEKHHG